MVDGINCFDQLVKRNCNWSRWWLHKWVFTRLSLFQKISKQQTLDADSKAMQQINVTGNLERDGNTQMFFIIEEGKETVLDFSKWTVTVL